MKIESNIDEITDKLGRGIDEGIKKVVLYLNILGIKTTQSCEGHEEEDRYSHFYVDFKDKENEYDKALELIYDFNRQNFNIIVDRRAYYDPSEKVMYCRMMPLERKKDKKCYDRNKELLKDLERYLEGVINKN